jgi:hypothetical protein
MSNERGKYGADGDRGNYAAKPGGWKPVLIVCGIAVAIYALSPGARHYYKHRVLPPHPDDERELEQIARDRGFPSVREYEEAVIAVARNLEKKGATVTLGSHIEYLEPDVKRSA